MLEPAEVELNLAVEPAERRLDEIGVLRHEGLEAREGLGVEPGHEVEDDALDVVHARVFGELAPVVVRRPALEPLEGPLDRRAVVRAAGVPADGQPVAADQRLVADRRELGLQRGDRPGQPAEPVGARIVVEVRPRPASPRDCRSRSGMSCRSDWTAPQ